MIWVDERKFWTPWLWIIQSNIWKTQIPASATSPLLTCPESLAPRASTRGQKWSIWTRLWLLGPQRVEKVQSKSRVYFAAVVFLCLALWMQHFNFQWSILKFRYWHFIESKITQSAICRVYSQIPSACSAFWHQLKRANLFQMLFVCSYEQQLYPFVNVPLTFLTLGNLAKTELLSHISSKHTKARRTIRNQMEYIFSCLLPEFIAQRTLWNEIIHCGWSCKYDIEDMLNGDCSRGEISIPVHFVSYSIYTEKSLFKPYNKSYIVIFERNCLLSEPCSLVR